MYAIRSYYDLSAHNVIKKQPRLFLGPITVGTIELYKTHMTSMARDKEREDSVYRRLFFRVAGS